MMVGRLFVALGVKGPKQAIGAIDGVKKSLKDTASMGIEAKAAILGAVYALERMFSKSGQAGTDLTNFNAALGISTQTLQEYQYAARQVGVSNEAVAGTFANIQKIITNVKLNKGAPESMALLGQLTGMTIEDFFKSDFRPEILIQKVQEAALKLKDAPGLKNKLFSDFGFGEDMGAAVSRDAFRPEVMAKAPKYSENEIKQLDKANVAWSNLGNKIEMAIGKMNAEHGLKLVENISKIADQVLRVTEAFIKLAEKLKLFEAIGKVFEGWEKIFSGLSGGVESVGDKVSGFMDDPKKSTKEFKQEIKGFFSDLVAMGKYAYDESKEFVEDVAPEATKFVAKEVYGEPPTSPVAANPKPSPVGAGLKIVQPNPPPGAGAIGPQAAAPAAAPANVQTMNNNVTVSQNLNFQHDGRDAKQTGDSVKRAAQSAFRQMPGLAQGS